MPAKHPPSLKARSAATTLRLPDAYVITPDPAAVGSEFYRELECTLRGGARLVQLRAPSLDKRGYADCAAHVLKLCRIYGAHLLLNAEPELLAQVPADGVHLSSSRLFDCKRRPIEAGLWLAASCHDAWQIERAQRLGVDFVVISPVKPTATHPGATPLGWDGFRRLVGVSAVPAYALGGMTPPDIPRAVQCGGQGVAAIRGLWVGA